MGLPRIFTRREIEGLIAAGDTIIISQGNVLRLNGWKEKHPGGRLVLDHMIGRDATDEINVSHSADTLLTMYRYRVGTIIGPWDNFVPPIQGGTFSSYPDPSKEERKLDPFWKTTNEGKKGDCCESDVASVCSSVELSDANLENRCGHGPCTPSAAESLLSPDEYIASNVQAEIDLDVDKYPALDPVTQRNIALEFQALHQRVKDEDFYTCRMVEYGKEMMRYTSLLAVFLFFLKIGWYFPSACFLGLFWHQIMFTAHDAGHRAITHDLTKDTLIGIFIADLCCGLSIGWWKSSHNVHHLVTNAPEHDPDIQNVPLFATAPSFLSTTKSTYYGIDFPWDAFAGIAVTVQKYSYYPVMAVARFNLYLLSWGYLLSERSRTKGRTWWTRPTEIACISIYFFLYFYVLLYSNIPTWTSRAIFLLTSHLITMPLHVQITLSHWGTSTADLGPVESFAQRQLRTTMDVSCPQWLDFIHGGLQFQAVHHLFPRVPRHNLRRLQALVKEFCAETEIEYLIHGFAKGNGVVLSRLQQIAEQAKMLAACQEHMAITGESGLH